MSELNISLKSSIVTGRGRIDRIPGYLGSLCKRVLILKDPAVPQETAQNLSDILSKKGYECVIYSNVSKRGTTRDIDPLVRFMNKSFTQALIAIGGFKTLNIGRFAAAAADSGINSDDILDSSRTYLPPGSLVYIEIPSSVRFPYMFTSLGIITDGRNRSVKIKDLKINPGLIVKDPEVFESLPQKNLDALYFDIVLYSLEALSFRNNNLFTNSLLESALVQLFSPENEFTADDLSEISLSADFVYSLNGPGTVFFLCTVISAVSSIPKSFIAAVLAPHFFEFLMEKTAGFKDTVLSRICPACGAEADDLVMMLRKKIKLKNLPIRLSELGVKKEMIPLIAGIYSEYNLPDGRIQILSEKDLLEILRKAF